MRYQNSHSGKNMKLSRAMLTIGASLSLAACFNSNPSESDGKEAALKVYKQYIDSGDVVLADFKKTDGTAMVQNGVSIYQMKVDVTLKFPKGIKCSIDLYKKTDPNYDAGKCITLGKTLTDEAPGATSTTPHQLTFIKSEKGWSLAPLIGYL
jgi:hypothetical protein